MKYGKMVNYEQFTSRYARWRKLSMAAQRVGESAGRAARSEVSQGLKQASDSRLFHKQLDVTLREGHKRAMRQIRKKDICIPCCMQGRGEIPDMLLEVSRDSIRKDFMDGLFALQPLGKAKLSGPLYQLRLRRGADDESEDELPFDTIRVLAHNMTIDPVTELPVTIGFVYRPENEPVRVRLPVQYMNEERCHGLKEGGWINSVVGTVEINVAPFVKAPRQVTMNLAGMGLRARKTIADLEFEGKGEGCRTVAEDDKVVTVISKV